MRSIGTATQVRPTASIAAAVDSRLPAIGHRLVVHQRTRGMGATVPLVHRAGRDDDVEAAPGQGDGRAAPDAAAGARDERDPRPRRHYIIPAIWCPPSTWSTCPLT